MKKFPVLYISWLALLFMTVIIIFVVISNFEEKGNEPGVILGNPALISALNCPAQVYRKAKRNSSIRFKKGPFP